MNTSGVRILLQRALVQNVTKVNRYSVWAKQLPAVSHFAPQNPKKLQVIPAAGTGLRYCSAKSGKNRFDKACIDASLVATYEEIVALPSHPEKLLIDVRDASEIAATGAIPTSINIPVDTIADQLKLSSEAFQSKYGRKKPATNDPMIFTCCVGQRSGVAAFEADKLGFKNIKNYTGSWQEYATKNNLNPGPARVVQ
ncbi:rhodanese domain-containing protein CG4456-like [Sabethes cyaneus]|uniref:rhodanese domain-containing protein CG4456-like n=1 Tax=Sabethes cyaneus TaxID=53552 RepID=UPI00237EA415|nr:rhodanese domain-containing protein CG4456-like [Sabethes cyaneus]